MITNTVKREVESHTNGASEFTISGSGKAKAKAFRVLINGLYANKIQSVTREIWANALDSHIMAGIPQKPFDVSFPNVFEPNFRVKDYGVGLSHDEVIGLYTTLFESTKEDTNEQTGKFGLGSKSPFSYTDSFSVVSIKNGEKNFYSAILDEDGIPTIHHMHSEACNEPNGVEVSFPVRKDDIKAFQNAAKRVALGFDVKPTVTNQSDFDWEDDYSAILEDGIYVKMGCVLYPVDHQLIDEEYYRLNNNHMRTFIQKCRDICTVFEVPMGSVEMSASRESLSYGRNEPTLKSIIKRFDEYYLEMQVFMQDFLNSMKTLHFAEALYYANMNNESKKFICDKNDVDINDLNRFLNWKGSYEIKYKNTAIKKQNGYRYSSYTNNISFLKTSFYYLDMSYSSKITSSSLKNSLNFEYTKENIIYVKDLCIPSKRSYAARKRDEAKMYAEIFKERDTSCSNSYVSFAGSYEEKIRFFDTLDTKFVRDIDYKIVFVDELPVPAPAKRAAPAPKRSLEDRYFKMQFEVYTSDYSATIYDYQWKYTTDLGYHLGANFSDYAFLAKPDSKVIHITKKVGSEQDFYNTKRFNTYEFSSGGGVDYLFKEMSRFFGMPIVVTTYTSSKLFKEYMKNAVDFDDLDMDSFNEHMLKVYKEFLDSKVDLRNLPPTFIYKHSHNSDVIDVRQYGITTGVYAEFSKFYLDTASTVCHYTTQQHIAAEKYYKNLASISSSRTNEFNVLFHEYLNNTKMKQELRLHEDKVIAKYPMLQYFINAGGYLDNPTFNAFISYIKLADTQP